jgi:hypothetical protein
MKRSTQRPDQIDGNGKHEHRIPKSPKKHSVQERPIVVAKEQIGIEIDGVTVTLSRWDAYVRQIYTMALNKNNGAARLLDQLRRQFPGDLPPGDEITFVISEDDAKL